MKLTDMTTALEVLIEAIRTDYRDWQFMSNRNRGGAAAVLSRADEFDDTFDILPPTIARFVDEFSEKLVIRMGNKYAKICTENGGSVWGFVVVTENDPKFPVGTILKAAGYNAPARNASRGNVLTGYKVNWTGPNYLR
jgi:hypothetical protein